MCARERNLEDDSRIKGPGKDPFNLKAEEVNQFIKRVGDCNKIVKRNASKTFERGTRVWRPGAST